jgi:beta-phosphoglucomutase-like phosphatase (HAD superfamily)
VAWGGELTGLWHWHRGLVAPSKAVIFDIDGVLSDAAGRQHYIEQGRRDWNAFFEACGDDPVIAEQARLLDLLDSDLQIILLTGRPSRVAPQTLAWLERYGLRFDVLVMRDWGDYSQVSIFKRDVVHDLRRYGFALQLA